MENFKEIKGFEGLYEISDQGRIRYLDKMVERGKWGRFLKKGALMAPYPAGRGYYKISLRKNKNLYHNYIHRIVAETFIPNPENKKTVNHINGIKTDNRVENLEWMTYSENNKHSFDTGLKKPTRKPINRGQNSPNAKFKDEDIRVIRKIYSEGVTQEKISKIYNVCRQTIGSIITRKNWSHIL